MTKKHFIDAAAIVRNILQGEWTNDSPPWADFATADCLTTNRARAVYTAEAFVVLFTQHNDRFDTQRFLIACGLVAAPVKAKRGKRS